MKSIKIVSGKANRLYLQLFLAVFFSFGTFCQAADFFVDDDTCSAEGPGTSTNPYCSIQYAIDQADSGDTVYVYAGTYAEGITMKTGVDLLNVAGEQPTIVTSAADNLVFFDKVNNCTLDGFILDDSNRTVKGFALIFVEGDNVDPGDGLAIRNCEILGDQVQGNAVARNGIRLKGNLSLEITGNTIKNMLYIGLGVKKPGSDTLYDSTITIQGNTITQNGYTAIYLEDGSGNRIIIGGDAGNANTISGNGFGNTAFAKGAGVRIHNMQGVSIDNNEIFNNSHAGIVLIDVDTVAPHIAGNTIHDNLEAGINISGYSTLTIGSNNEIYSNDRSGITFYGEGNGMINSTGLSGVVSITGNDIHTNVTAGISVIDNVTGSITIDGNSIYQNEKAGIAFFNHATAVVTNNDIYDHTGAAGIFTGAWLGLSPPNSIAFNRANGPVDLTISRNKIHDNLSGMRLDHASGTISNNLVYNNTKSGIRFSGNDISPYEPFGALWGITELTNNTVADNGTVIDGVRRSAGIVYDDINNVIDRNFFDRPVVNRDQGPRTIQNNIAAHNATAGIKDAACTVERDYNLYYLNFGNVNYAPSSLGSCFKNSNEIFVDPLFVDRVEYKLQPGSPAKSSGNDNRDMGAYGGSNPILW